MAGGGRALVRWNAGRAPEQARLPATARHHGLVDQPGVQAGPVPRQLPRLRHPALPRSRSTLRHARGTVRPRGSGTRRRHLRPVLDIILNHAGPVFSYRPDRYWTERDGQSFLEPRWDGQLYDVAGYNDARATPPCPSLRSPSRVHSRPTRRSGLPSCSYPPAFSRLGQITNWDYDPEFLDGDFFELKGTSTSEPATPTTSSRPRPCGSLAEILQVLDGLRRSRPATGSTPSSTWLSGPHATSPPTSTSSRNDSAKRTST